MSQIAISWQDHLPPGPEAALLPSGLAVRRFDWRVEPWPVDGGMPAPVAAILAEALIATGPVAGYWVGAPPPHASLFPAPRPPLPRRVWERLTGRGTRDVLLSDRAAGVALLIDAEWSAESQVLLLLDRDRDPSAAVAQLARCRDWRGAALPTAARAILRPGVDGDSVLIGARDAVSLGALVAALDAAFRAAGFAVG